MSLPIDDRRREWPGNGVTVTFNGPNAYEKEHLFVYLLEAGVLTLVDPSQWNVKNLGRNNGSRVTMVTPPTGTQTLVILRTVPVNQLTDITNQGAFLPETLEKALDYQAMISQQLEDGVNRSLRFADNVVPAPSNILPPAQTGLPLVFDADGSLIVGSSVLTGDMALRPNLAAGTDGLFTQAGVGAVTRGFRGKLRDVVNVKDFDALGDGVANDTASIVAALAAGAGGTVRFSKGVYKVHSQIDVPADTIIDGDGAQAIIIPGAAVNSLFRTTGNNAQIRGLQLLNAGGFATAGITFGSDFGTVENCYFSNLKRPIQVDGAQALRIVQNTMIGQDFGVFIINDGRNSVIDNCHIQGGTPIYITKGAIQCEGLRVVNCFLAPNVTADANSGHGIVIEGGLELIIAHNIIDNVDKYGIYLTGANATEAIKIFGNWFGMDAAVAASGGVYSLGGTKQVQVIGNTFTGADGFGVNVDYVAGGQPNAWDISHNRFFANDSGDLRMDNLLTSVVSNNFFNSSSVSTTEQDNNSTVTVTNNLYTLAPAVKSSSSSYSNNQGPAGVNTNFGTYTPTLTNVTNVSASTAYDCTWGRVGDTVTVSGRVDATASIGATLTTFRMSLPVPSNFVNIQDAGGMATGIVNPIIYGVQADGATDTVAFQSTPTITGSQPMSFQFTYRVK